jgi:hypothetical protein
MRDQFHLLDKARTVVLRMTDSGDAAAVALAAAQEGKKQRSLKRDALKCIGESSAMDGVPASVVAEMLEAAYGYKPTKSLYSSVYVTLKRLAEKGHIVAKRGKRGLVFAALHPTARLFQ